MQATRNFSTNLNNPQTEKLNILSDRCNWLYSQFFRCHSQGDIKKAEAYLAVYYDVHQALQDAIDLAMAEALEVVRNGS